MSEQPIIVIGAGICGVSTAIWLQRSGHRVILMDNSAPWNAASFGNAGLIAQWAVAPVTSPSLWFDAPKKLIKPDSALFMKWSYLPKMLPWLVQYMTHANDRDTRSIVSNLIPILTDALDQHKALTRGTQVERWIRDSKFNYAYQSYADFKAAAYSWELKKMAGYEPKIYTGPSVQEEEPMLDADTQCLAVLEGHGHITNPGQYVAGLADHFTQEGGTFIKAKVQDFHLGADGRVTHIDTDHGQFECSRAVVTAGIWSKELMKKLKLRIPLEAERGYHVLYENPSISPRNPTFLNKASFVICPMEIGLRCAGIVELGDHKAGPSKAPIRLIRSHIEKAFPNLTYTNTQEWMGFRPSTPDSLPVIGELGNTGIYAGFGHQHIGLTAGPKTGRLIAQIIDGQTPNVDMSPYDPARFTQ